MHGPRAQALRLGDGAARILPGWAREAGPLGDEARGEGDDEGGAGSARWRPRLARELVEEIGETRSRGLETARRDRVHDPSLLPAWEWLTAPQRLCRFQPLEVQAARRRSDMKNEEPKIGEFLITLSEDMELLKAYVDDPYPLFEEFGLTDSQQEILLSNDVGRLREALQGEYPDREIFVAFG